MTGLKKEFMRNAPTFVFAGALAIFSLILIVGARLAMCDDKFGFYLIGLILAASGTIVYAVKVFSKGCDKTFSKLMKEHKEYWESDEVAK